jgi:hypothetical protein
MSEQSVANNDLWEERTVEPVRTPVGKTSEPRAKIERIDTNRLMAMDFPPVQWCVPEYVPEGFSVLAGRQKLGKTWLAIDWAIACATGGCAMGSIQCEQGDVLYIDLENGLRRAQDRINVLFPSPRNRPDLSRLQWQNQSPALGNGFLQSADEWRLSVEKPRLLVIDVLQRVKPPGTANRNAYENDYSIFAELQHWSLEHAIAVLGLHHTRKGGADDPLESLSGSNGLSACADTTLVLDRDANGTSLYIRGRDVLEKKSALRFLEGQWIVTGDAESVTASNERGNILRVLLESDEPMSPTEIGSVTGMKSGNTRKLLFSMAKAGEVRKSGYGRYVHPEHVAGNDCSTPAGNTGNSGNSSDDDA